MAKLGPEQASYPLTNTWAWPFSLSDLTAGLRRYLQDPTVRVLKVEPYVMAHRQPSIGRVRAVNVQFSRTAGEGTIRLVVKEPHGTTRTGLAGAGRREAGFYRSFAQHVPLLTPTLLAASPIGEWLLLEEVVPILAPQKWRKEDYLQAIDALVCLHDRYWNLEDDLNTFPWLSRPLGSDFVVHVEAAAKAIERIVHEGQPELLAEAQDRMRILATLTMEADRIARPLQNQTSTLIHGDYWPGNILVPQDNRQVVFDWQLAGVGPGIMDLLVFINKSLWWFRELPISPEAIISRYREGLQSISGVTWEEEAWSELWDHALMWRFLQEWVDLLAASPDALITTSAAQLDEVWLHPVAQAVERRLPSANGVQTAVKA